MTDQCRLCKAEAAGLFSLRILGQHEAKYFRCGNCDLIQTELPYWLEQAYTTTYSALDVGVLYRNQFCTRLTLAVAKVLGLPASAPCLDYGGGHGIFTRLMRDAGCNFVWYDKLGPNLFARKFEGLPQAQYKLVTCFEVFEHFVNVQEELARLFQPQPDYVLAGTILHSNPGKDWWYLVPESGQHVAFYSRRTMQQIGATFGYQVLCGAEFALFMKQGRAPSGWRRAIARRLLNSFWLASSVGFLIRRTRPTLTYVERDYRSIKASLPGGDSR
jgi:hypothetical protein